MSTATLTSPHGGKLMERTGAKQDGSVKNAITLTEWQQCDFEMIGCGAMSPLDGYMGQADYNSVCDKMTLANGTVWPIPITLAVDDATAAKVNVGWAF